MDNVERFVLISASIDALCNLAYENARKHGFWFEGENRNKGEMIALIHSEVSEMLEGVRKPQPDQHCPEFTSEEIEAADILIRIFDYAQGHHLRLSGALFAKMKFNEGRPHKHGKAF